MRPDQREVISLPLGEIWNDAGPLAATRGRQLGVAEIAELLRAGPVQFVVADVGPLRWVPLGQTYNFWKNELKAHVLPLDRSLARLEDFPGEYFYLATQWTRVDPDIPLVLLERHH